MKEAKNLTVPVYKLLNYCLLLIYYIHTYIRIYMYREIDIVIFILLYNSVLILLFSKFVNFL